MTLLGGLKSRPWRTWMAALAGFFIVAAPLWVFAMPESFRIPIVKPHEKGDPPDAAAFSHWEHNQYYCYSCHPTLFPQARVGFTHEDMDAGRYCGACHNGNIAWGIDDADTECEFCHRESEP